jgi:hypothetical protein
MLTSRVRSSVGAGDKNDFVLLPECLELLLTNHILHKAKRDEAPKWVEEIVTSPDCQKHMEWAREALVPEWCRSAGKGQQGSQMTNKNMTDTGLSLSMDDFVNDLLERGVMKDLNIAPRPPVVGMAVEKVILNLSALDIKSAFAAAQDVDVTGGASGIFKQGGNKGAGHALEMGNANHQVPTTAIRTRTMAAQSSMAAPIRETAALVRVRRGV